MVKNKEKPEGLMMVESIMNRFNISIKGLEKGLEGHKRVKNIMNRFSISIKDIEEYKQRGLKIRYRAPSEIARLDLNSWTGELIDRTKAKTTEKPKGLMMVESIMNRFSISMKDINKYKQRALEIAKMDANEIRKPGLFENLSKDKLENLRKPLRPWKK